MLELFDFGSSKKTENEYLNEKLSQDLTIKVVDQNVDRISAWNDSDVRKIPVYEPGLEEIVERVRGKNLFFSLDVDKSIEEADMVFISVNTPIKKTGLGAGKASDIRWVEKCARQIGKAAKGKTIVVEKSTLPVKTAQTIKEILVYSSKDDDSKSFAVLSNPEFLAEGTAIKDLENPDRVLIGGEDKDAIDSLHEIYRNWVSEEKILHTNIWSSELAKLTANAFLAQRISSINSISAICETTGADIREVSRAIGSDSRIGSKFLDAGPGFGGSCFKKDILNLVYLCEFFGLNEVANFWEGVVTLNNWHQSRISELIVKKLYGTLSEKKIIILGFSFKANTNDTRESAAIQICKDLIEEGAQLIIHDPKVEREQIALDLGLEEKKENNAYSDNYDNLGNWTFSNNLETIFNGAHAAVILTEWNEYSFIDWEKESLNMNSPAWVFDSRSLLAPEKLEDSGLNFWRVGDGSEKK